MRPPVTQLQLKDLFLDCDGDALLVKVEPVGPTCHTGERACFFSRLDSPETKTSESWGGILERLYQTIQERKRQPSSESYTSKLLEGGVDRILKKVVEEAGEVAIAGKGGKKDEIVYETADLLFHTCGGVGISRHHAARDLSGTGDSVRQVWLEKRPHLMSECLFCKIVARTIPATLVYEDDVVVAFDDINPQAPTHTLVIPRKHVTSIAELQDLDVGLTRTSDARREQNCEIEGNC